MTEMIYGSMSVPTRKREGIDYWWNTIDRTMLGAIIALFLLGMVFSMAASMALANKNSLPLFYYVSRQLIFGIVALATMFVISRFNITYVRRLGVLGFLGAMVLLLLLPIVGTDHGKGAVRWISFGFASIQPSEFLKPGFVIMVAWLVSAGKTNDGPPGRLIATGLTGFLVLVLALQPDFGQASLLVLSFFAILFVAGTNVLWIGAVAVVVGIAGRLAYLNSEHVAGRINQFLSGDVDPYTQIGIAANAISEGGVFGKGIGEGSIKASLPDAHTDFIIAVVAEELGVISVWIISALFAFIVVRCFTHLMRMRDTFSRLAGVGLATLIGAQSMINLGVSARILPTKGMTLPFISYGGSSLVAIGITFGFMLAITRMRPSDDHRPTKY